MRAAHDDAAGGTAGCTVEPAVMRGIALLPPSWECSTDGTTLGRVAAILRGELGGGIPALDGYWPPTLALPVPVRRSATLLAHTRRPVTAGGRP